MPKGQMNMPKDKIVAITQQNKPYELLPLEARHIMPMLTLIRKIGFKELKNTINEDVIKKIVGIFNVSDEHDDGGGKIDFAEIGLELLPTVADILDVILANIEKAEKEIFGFLESISNLTSDEIKHLPLALFAQMVADVVRKEEFGDFFGVVSKFIK